VANSKLPSIQAPAGPDRTLWLIHALNAAWFLRLLVIYLHSDRLEVNFLGDPLFAALLAATCMAHVFRWRRALRASIDRTFTSTVDLTKAIRETGELAYKRIPYLPALLPNDAFITEQAGKALLPGGEVHISVASELFALLLRSGRLIWWHFVIATIAIAFLFVSGFPSFGTTLRVVPFSLPVLAAVAAGMGIYAVSSLIYLALPRCGRDARDDADQYRPASDHCMLGPAGGEGSSSEHATSAKPNPTHQLYDLGGALVYAVVGGFALLLLWMHRLLTKKKPSRAVEERMQLVAFAVFVIATAAVGFLWSDK
jgi:hypothetical protein